MGGSRLHGYEREVVSVRKLSWRTPVQRAFLNMDSEDCVAAAAVGVHVGGGGGAAVGAADEHGRHVRLRLDLRRV